MSFVLFVLVMWFGIQGSHASWKILESPEKWPRFWKVLEIYLQCPGMSWNLLGNDVHGSFWFQIDMFMQLKIAVIVAIRYVVWAAGMPKMLPRLGFLPARCWRSLQRSPRLLAVVCCYIWTLLAYDRVLEKCFWGPGKFWKSPGIFCNQESGKPWD